MLRGIFALFFRSLRGDSRSVWVHATWFFLLAVIYVSMWIAQEQSAFYGAPGLLFFRSVVYANAVFITLLGISYFSSAISEEKEEDTLGLMTMAGISPLGILLGKSTTRLFQVFLLLAVQYPFTLLAITLGGLLVDQIYAAYAALIAYTILLANVGLFFSVLCRRNRDAAGLTTLWMVAYGFVPIFAYAGYYFLAFGPGKSDPRWAEIAPIVTPLLLWVSETNIFGQLNFVTETGYQFALTPQLVSNTLGGLGLFLLSWWLFGFVSHDPAPEATTRALVPRKTGRFRWFGAGRAWNAALAWKDFHFIAGGWFGIVVRCGLYVGLYWMAFAATYPWDQPTSQRQVSWRDVTWGYQVFVVPLFAVDCAMCASRLFQEEIRHQTLSTLLMLPRNVAHVVFMKIAGCLAAVTPGIIALFSAFFLLRDTQMSWHEFARDPTWFWLVANLIFAIHLSAMLSLYLRWGALAMSIALTVGSMMIETMIVTSIYSAMTVPGQMPLIDHRVLMGIMAVPVLIGCAGCHMIILLGLPALGRK